MTKEERKERVKDFLNSLDDYIEMKILNHEGFGHNENEARKDLVDELMDLLEDEGS